MLSGGNSKVQVKCHQAENINGGMSASENVFVIFCVIAVCRYGFISARKGASRLLQMTHETRQFPVSVIPDFFNSRLMINSLQLKNINQTLSIITKLTFADNR